MRHPQPVKSALQLEARRLATRWFAGVALVASMFTASGVARAQTAPVVVALPAQFGGFALPPSVANAAAYFPQLGAAQPAPRVSAPTPVAAPASPFSWWTAQLPAGTIPVMAPANMPAAAASWGLPWISGGRAPNVSDVLATNPACPPIQVAPGVYVPIPCNPVHAPSTQARTRYPAGTLPPSVDLSGFLGEVKDQKKVGVCWAFALAASTEAELAARGIREVISTLHLIGAEEGERLYVRGNKQSEGTPIVSEALWPYDERRACLLTDKHEDACGERFGFTPGSWRNAPWLEAEFARADAQGRYRIARDFISLEPDEWATLLSQGHTLDLWMRIDSKSWDGGSARDGSIADYPVSTRGSHAVVVTGYTWINGARHFRIRNSWGASWGQNGSAWISEVTLRRHVEHVFTVSAYLPGEPVRKR